MQVQEYVDMIEFELLDIQSMYAQGAISLAEMDDMIYSLTDSKNAVFDLKEDSELAEKLISAILEVYCL